MAELTLMELQVLMFYWHEMMEDNEDKSVVLAEDLFAQHAMVMLTNDARESTKLKELLCQIAEIENDIVICEALYASLYRLYEPWAHLVKTQVERATLGNR